MAAFAVTGAAGFIGAHLTRRLAALGHAVRAVDVKPRPPALAGAGISYHQLDVRDGKALDELLRGVETVYHLASVHLEVRASRKAFEDVNVRAAERLVSACVRAGVRRMVHTSSVGVYGHVADPPAREDSPANPETPYEQTKLAGETAALRRAAELGSDVLVLRPSWVYGPGCPRTRKLIATVRKGRFVYVGDGSNLRHPLFIEDMLDACVLAAEAPGRLARRVYVVAGPRYMPLRELVDTTARVLSALSPQRTLPRAAARNLALVAEAAFGLVRRDPPFSRRSLAFFENDNAFDTAAARRDLGFVPKVDLHEGLERTLDSDTPCARSAE